MGNAIKVPYKQHFVFDEALGLDVREGFLWNGKICAGVQPSSWQRDLFAWNFRRGRYGGFEVGDQFQRGIPINLRVEGAGDETSGGDPLNRVAAGTHLALCETGYDDNSLTVPTSIEFRLYNAADGSCVTTFAPYVNRGTTSCPFPFANGSYVLWARCIQGPEVELRAGQWSALKIRCGSGAFTINVGVCPSPGAALYAKDVASAEVAITSANAGTYRVLFDVLASSVSASAVTHSDILHGNGSVDVAAGSQILGVLRASRNGPQAALYVLHADFSARLLGVSGVFSNGLCECGKADHHATDAVQGPDNKLYLLNECSLHVYAPDAPTLDARLPGTPRATEGEPGGHCLRFSEGVRVFLTEKLVPAPPNQGFYFYNRLILRLANRDEIGCGTIWEGPGAIETFKGKLWGMRGGAGDLQTEGARVYLDSIQSGAWQNGGTGFPAANFWRQLRARGNQLWLFGFDDGGVSDFANGKEGARSEFAGTGDTPITAVWGTDGQIRLADFPFLVRRVTPGTGTLVCTCNDPATGQSFHNDGHSLRIVELPVPADGSGSASGATKVCAFWNAGTAEFRMTQSAFTDAGGDISKLPPYLGWLPLQGRNGGGVWQAKTVRPAAPYLTLDTGGSSLIRYQLTGTLPYSAATWGVLCFEIMADGSISPVSEPQPSDTNAGQALNHMPTGSQFRVLQTVPPEGGTTSVIQVTDPSRNTRFLEERELYPTLWARQDSSAALSDLTSYRQLLRFSREQSLSGSAGKSVDVVLLVTPDNLPFEANELPILQRRTA